MIQACDPSLDPYIEAVCGKKALAPVVLDVGELTSIADVFIICSARSNRQVTAIADHVVRHLKKQGIRPLSVEGKAEGHWALLDYGHVIIHVFYEPVRYFYDIEGLWNDARRLKPPVLVAYEKTSNPPSEPQDDADE